jgi:hypothetical protein
MTTQFSGAANLYGPHGSKMAKGHLVTIGFAISRPKGTKNIGHL